MTSASRSATRLAQSLAAQSSARQWRADVLDYLFWVPMVISVALFLADGGMYRFRTLGGGLTAIGIIAGLLATTGVCAMLLLTARLPYIDRTLGQVRATELHARFGQWTIAGLGAHAAFLIVGYAVVANQTLVAEFLAMWGMTDDFALAVLGMALFLVLSVTSFAASRRRLPYEVWHALHLLSYAAVAVSIPHMFSMGGLFYDNTPQRWYWMAMLGFAGLALAVYRVIVPLLVTVNHGLRVKRIVPVSSDTFSIELRGRNLADLHARAGQYFHWRFLAPGFWWHQHPFSLSAAPTDSSLRITVRALGKGSAALVDLKPGTRVALEGPYGVFTDAARTRESVVLIGAGIGITPIRALLETTPVVPGRATVIMRSVTADRLFLLDEITDLCQRRGVTLRTLLGEPAPGRWVPQGHANLRLTDVVPYVTEADVYVCGPSGFTDLVIEEALALGVPASQIHDERFNW